MQAKHAGFNIVVTADQLRAARAMAQISLGSLAERAGLATATLKRYESCVGPVFGDRVKIAALVTALETAGIVFLPDEGCGAGLRLRKSARANSAELV